MSPLDLRKIVVDASQKILVPDIQEIKHLNQRIDSLEQKIENFREESHQRADSLERQIQTNREDYKLAVNLHERIAALEARLPAR